MALVFTSTGVQEIGSLYETQVTCPGPQCLRVTKAELGVEVVGLEALLPVDGVVATGVVRAVHPDLKKQGVHTHFRATSTQSAALLFT